MRVRETGQASRRESYFYSINYFSGTICLQGTAQHRIVTLAAATVVIADGYKMFAEKHLRRRYDKGLRKAQQRWEDWIQQRLESAAQGKEISQLTVVYTEEPGSIR